MSERPPGRDPTKHHTHIRCFLSSESQISRITLTKKSVTSGNPPSKHFWFIAIPTAVLALLRCLLVVLRYVSAQSQQRLNMIFEINQ